ncbi:MAG: patatin family protein [Adlercreutzia sp.]
MALIFEGGGMRNSYTAGMVVELLARNLNFGRVYGISAGSSHTVNYLVRDPSRARASFVELVKYPRFGGWGSFLAGHGYFNGPYLYEELIENAPAGDPMAFDWDTFAANPADMHIEAMDWDTGETVAWTKADMREARDVGLMVRASSTMPLFMPPTTIGEHTYVDGGMGDSWGILLNAARTDGYERFCIIRTQPRSYRKKPMGAMAPSASSAPLSASTPLWPSAPSPAGSPITNCATRSSGWKSRARPGSSTPTPWTSPTAPPTTTPSFAPTKPASPKPSATSPPSWSGWAKQCLSKKETPAKCGGFPSTPIAGNVSEVPTGAWNCPALGPSWLRPTPSPKQGARPGACRNRSVESFDVALATAKQFTSGSQRRRPLPACP